MVSKKPSVLIVDDEQVVCDVLHDELSERGYLCTAVLSGIDALSKLATEDFQVVLLDIRLPGMSGMEVLQEIWLNHGNPAVIMITAVNDVNTAVEAMKLGAWDYIVKPFDLERVSTSIGTVLETKQAAKKPCTEMDAVARGVEARYDLPLGLSRIMTQETVDIARHLGIPEKEIQQWAAARARLDSERDSLIKSGLNKLERNPLAQRLLGMTELHRYTPKPSESQN